MQDIAYLKKSVSVTVYFFLVKSKLLVPVYMKLLFLFLLFSKKQDFIVSFGGYHSFVATLVAKLKGVKAYVILNGTDVTSMPEYHYGHLRKGLLRYCCRKSYEWATKLLPVSESLMSTENSYGYSYQKPLGLLHEFPKLETPSEVIPNGFDTDFWRKSTDKISDSFITVASASRVVHKGVDLMIEFAKSKPDYSFSIAGIQSLPDLPSNVKCLGFLSAEQLREAYSSHQFYFQLSLWEGFGCALCEAMLCECIPLVSNVNTLPEIAGSDQYVLKKKDLAQLSQLVDRVMKEAPNSNSFRDHIVAAYPIEKRMTQLKKNLFT